MRRGSLVRAPPATPRFPWHRSVPVLVPASVTPKDLSLHSATTCIPPPPTIILASSPPVFPGCRGHRGGVRGSPLAWSWSGGDGGSRFLLRSEDPRPPPAAPQGSAAVGSFLGLTPIPVPRRHGCLASRPLSATSHSHTHWGKGSWKRSTLASGFTGLNVISAFADGKQGSGWGRAMHRRRPIAQEEKLLSPEREEKNILLPVPCRENRG